MAGAGELAGDGTGHQVFVPRIVIADAFVKRPEEDRVDQPERNNRQLVLAGHRPGRRRRALVGTLGFQPPAEPRPQIAAKRVTRFDALLDATLPRLHRLDDGRLLWS